jgi:hypothetical protein
MNEMTILVVEGSVIFSVDIGLSFLRNTNAEYFVRPLHCLLLALAIFETGCAAQQQAENSDPMLQRIEQPKVHGEVGVVYGQSAR